MARMRAISLVFLLVLVASGDIVWTRTGGTVGNVISVRVRTADGTIRDVARKELLAVHLDSDREFLDGRSAAANLLWARRRAVRLSAGAEPVAVYCGRGVFAPSAQAVVRRLDEARIPVDLWFDGEVDRDRLARARTLIVPGGWAPSIQKSMGDLAALRDFVRKGGRYLGICAGAYLACATVEWEGERFAYPLQLWSGAAVGPLPELAPWPRAADVALRLAGSPQNAVGAVYAGGSRFRTDPAAAWATYPDGTAAAVVVAYGKGAVALTGAHLEFAAKRDADLLRWHGWAPGVKGGDGHLFLKLLDKLQSRRRAKGGKR